MATSFTSNAIIQTNKKELKIVVIYEEIKRTPNFPNDTANFLEAKEQPVVFTPAYIIMLSCFVIHRSIA